MALLVLVRIVDTQASGAYPTWRARSCWPGDTRARRLGRHALGGELLDALDGDAAGAPDFDAVEHAAVDRSFGRIFEC